jgi:hypothetical protein
MQGYREMRSNLLKLDKVVSWLESKESELLWVDGSHNLTRSHWNSMFAVPVLRDAMNNYESVLIVRHFCGNYGASNKSNSALTVVQSFIVQVMKQHQIKFAQKTATFGKDRFTRAMAHLHTLWDLFLECLAEVEVQCIFIVVDSIDCLQIDEPALELHQRDIEIFIGKLNDLSKSEKMVAKILLTTSLTKPAEEMPVSMSTAVGFLAPQRRLSLDPMQQGMQMITAKLLEIDEGKCKNVTFPQIILLYRIGTTIFSVEGGETRAFVVSELRGGQKSETGGRFEPWHIRCWSIDHDNSVFVQRYHDISIPQFSGEKEVKKLKYIPSGYLDNEAEIRRRLRERGRQFWTYASGCHHLEYVGRNFRLRRKEASPISRRNSFQF